MSETPKLEVRRNEDGTVAVPVAEWLFRRLVAVDAAMRDGTRHGGTSRACGDAGGDHAPPPPPPPATTATTKGGR